MSNNSFREAYKRRVTPVERLFTRSPYSIVTMVARIKGTVTEGMLVDAIAKVRLRHPNLRVRIVEDENHDPWFTSEGAGDIPVEVVVRESDDHWVDVHEAACKIPFEFETRPAMRFILVRSPDISEVVILCHHILCDGLSLAYLARDLMVHLGDPTREVEVLPDPAPIDLETLPDELSLSGVARFFIQRMNAKWADEQVIFDQEDYRTLSEAYWARYRHRTLPIEFSEAQTSTLVERCRENGVTVNSALAVAIVGAQVVVQGTQPHHASIGVAASLRDRLRRPAGEVMGFYAGVARLRYRYREEIGFWENARRFHKKVKPLFTDKNLFADFLPWFSVDSTILEAINFKELGGLVQPGQPRYQKLSAFSTRDDIVSSLLRREKRGALDRIVMGTAVTNLTRMDFPRRYGALELDRLIMQPGGAFPLSHVNLVLGAVTCAGKLSLVAEYVEANIDVRLMEEIRDKALEFLFDETS